MFRKTDTTEQLDLFTSPSSVMGKRAVKRYTDPSSWHNQFFELVTSRIDEATFSVLFPEGKKQGRPNASVRVLVAMSVLKEGYGCSDEDFSTVASSTCLCARRWAWGALTMTFRRSTHGICSAAVFASTTPQTALT